MSLCEHGKMGIITMNRGQKMI